MTCRQRFCFVDIINVKIKINAGSLYLVEEVNDRNFRLCLTVKINVGSSLATAVNDCNIRLRL